MSTGLVMVCDVDLRERKATRTHTLEVAGAFVAEGLDVDLVARGPDPELPGVRYAGGVGTDHQRIQRIVSLNRRALGLLWRRRRTARFLYVRHNWTIVVILLLGRLLGYRIVTELNDMPYGRGYEQPISPLADYAKRAATWAMGRLADGVVAVTPQLKGLLVDQYGVAPETVLVLPNGVDVDFFHPLDRAEAQARLGLDPSRRYIVFCGVFAEWVDLDLIVESFALVHRQRPEARLLLVGDGDGRAQVEELAVRHGVSEDILITGYEADRARVRDYIAAGTVAVSANRLEHRARIGVSPVKLAEYLACGRAVVASDLPGLREMLEEPEAGVVTPVDPVAFSQALLGLLDADRAEAFGARGRELALQRFSWRLIVRRTLTLFSPKKLQRLPES